MDDVVPLEDLFVYRDLRLLDYMDVIKEMQKHLGVIPSDVNVNDQHALEEAITSSIRDGEDRWYAVCDIYTDEILCIAREYGTYYKAKGEVEYSPINSIMMFTPEQHRSKGYAEFLAQEIITITNITGFAVNPKNQASKRLMEKLGYIKIDEAGELIGEAVLMEIYLQGPSHGYSNDIIYSRKHDRVAGFPQLLRAH